MTDLREELARALFGPVRTMNEDFQRRAFEAIDDVLPIVARAIAAEREACAKVAAEPWRVIARGASHTWTRVDIAAAIRARGGE